VKATFASRAWDDAEHCGDQGGYWPIGGKVLLCLADGLGHGKQAEAAATAALDYVGRHLSEPLPALFQGCDKALRDTRGVAMGVAVADPAADSLTYAIIGNIHGVIMGGTKVALSAYSGIIGAGFRTLVPQSVPFGPGAVGALFTDGIREDADLSGYDAALLADPRGLSERVLGEWGKVSDDAGVLVFRNG